MSSASPPPPGSGEQGPGAPERPDGVAPPPSPPEQAPRGAWAPPAPGRTAPPPSPGEHGGSGAGPDAGDGPRFVPPRPHPLGVRDPETPWRPWMAPLALVAAFMIALVGQLVIASIGAAFGMSLDDPTPAVNILATLFQDAAFVGAALVFAKSAGPVRPRQLGLNRTRLWPAVGWSALTMAAFYLLSGLWAALLDISDADELPESFGVDESTVALVAVCVLVTVIAPIAEEVLFRGFFFGALRNWRGPWPAAVITGLVFGGIHAGSADVEFLVPLALLGFLLCVLRWLTGSLLPCIAVHALNNAIAFGVSQAGWPAWAVVLLMAGATAASVLLCRPFLDRGERPAAAAA